MENIYDKDYAPFMEEALQSMVQMPIAGICIISRLKDGSVFTQYHNSTTMDKMIYAGVIGKRSRRTCWKPWRVRTARPL